ncbi:hypothetical protein HDE76_003911 [Rhodanobacter sp. ANJX3]|uniref:hypothetical protein n=1 Tax=Rhodanobacter sp. ANJX3 TaxID=2723083 RepID=UPI001846F251|nr:hypothetical protein [Rhodanobacter sp. ANJX3]MBB5360665.1 hypothetical protein [Rhodanobacter sp. ANJX3]
MRQRECLPKKTAARPQQKADQGGGKPAMGAGSSATALVSVDDSIHGSESDERSRASQVATGAMQNSYCESFVITI